jgi:hypothetical protein
MCLHVGYLAKYLIQLAAQVVVCNNGFLVAPAHEIKGSPLKMISFSFAKEVYFQSVHICFLSTTHSVSLYSSYCLNLVFRGK